MTSGESRGVNSTVSNNSFLPFSQYSICGIFVSQIELAEVNKYHFLECTYFLKSRPLNYIFIICLPRYYFLLSKKRHRECFREFFFLQFEPYGFLCSALNSRAQYCPSFSFQYLSQLLVSY